MTDWAPDLWRLRDELADFCNTDAKAREFVARVGLDESRIGFTDTAATTWYSILREALLQEKIPDVFETACRDYPALRRLASGLECYGVEEPGPEPPPPPPQPKPSPPTHADLNALADLVVRSGRADSSARNALCLEIGVDPSSLDFLAGTAVHTFAVQLVFHLRNTGDTSALFQLCNAIAPILKGQCAEMLTEIRAKLG